MNFYYLIQVLRTGRPIPLFATHIKSSSAENAAISLANTWSTLITAKHYPLSIGESLVFSVKCVADVDATTKYKGES